MTEEIQFSVKEKSLAIALNCEPELVRSLWYQLKLDNFEKIEDINQIKEVSKTYIKMQDLTQKLHGLTKKLNNLYDSLPEDEKIRLLLQAHLLDQQTQGNKVETLLNELDVELGFLMAHRKHVYDRNPTRGGKDPRADQLAEFVACVFEASDRHITFGQRENKPTTNFGRAVQECLEICGIKLIETNNKVYLSNWRQPAYKAFRKRKK